MADILHETGLAANRLELEITESLLINDTEEVLAKLNRLRELGVRIAMDDFGTGYSSLSYLARFLLEDQDRPAVRSQHDPGSGHAGDRQDHHRTRRVPRVTITAEGVETQEQADMLRRLGCPQVQGFLYGRPEKATVHADKTMSDAVSMSQLPKRPSAA